MIKIWLLPIVLVLLILGLPGGAAAQSDQTISLEDLKVVAAGTDVKMAAFGSEGSIYSVVNQRNKYYIFQSQDKGKSWKKVETSGLPENENFIALKALTDQPVLVLASAHSVYISRNRGETFEWLGGPSNLKERGEEISSLAVNPEGEIQILIGVWHPQTGKTAEEGVYLWTDEDYIWEAQGMKPLWQGTGYKADVTAVAFSLERSIILALATGDPDREGILPEGTYLNIGFTRPGNSKGAEWNFSEWPLEIAENPGKSPKEKEILNAQIAFPEDVDITVPEESKFYILYCTRKGAKDGVYVLEGTEVRQLNFSPFNRIETLNSLAYQGTLSEGVLALGATVKNKDNKEQAQVYYLDSDEDRFSFPDWSENEMKVSGSGNCQIMFYSDGTIFAGTSGEGSSFAECKGKFLLPISLIDASGGINQLVPLTDFPDNRTFFFNYGNKNIIKLVLDRNYRFDYAENVFYVAEGFNKSQIRIESDSDKNIFIFEFGKKGFWQSDDGYDYDWKKSTVKIKDATVTEDKIWFVCQDNMVYRYWQENNRLSQQGISAGFSWLQKLELGPENAILAIGGNKEKTFDTIALIGDGRPEILPILPVSGKSIQVAFSSRENSVYAGINNQLYRFFLDGEQWEEIASPAKTITGIISSNQVLYLMSADSKVYFSVFPISQDPQWETLETGGKWQGSQLAELSEESKLLFFWKSSEILVFPHLIPEKEPEEEIPLATETPGEENPPETEEPAESGPPVIQPEEPEKIEPQPAEPEDVEVQPEITKETSSSWLKIVKRFSYIGGAVIAVVVFCLFIFFFVKSLSKQ